MASCITSQWSSSTTPQARLTVTLNSSSSDGDTAVLNWTLEYVAHGYAANTSVNKKYSVVINGETVKSGTYDIDGIKTTTTIASGSKYIAKTTSQQTISFSLSFGFNLTWSDKYGGTKTASGSIDIPAKTKYTISYNKNGGDTTPSSASKYHGQNITIANGITRSGYTFRNWNTSANGTGTSYAAGATYSANANVTLYAQWTPITYTIIFNANGGSFTGGSVTQTTSKTHNTPLSLNNIKPTRSNYLFLGWGTSKNGGVAYETSDDYTANANITLYAVWQLAYTKPRIKNFKVFRCNASTGTPDDSGTSFGCYFDWECDDPLKSLTLSWTPGVGSNVKSEDVTDSSSGYTSGTYNKTKILSGFTTETTYTFVLTVTDLGGSNTASATLPGAKFAIDFKAGGKGVGFGKPAELNDYADFGFEVCMNNQLRISGRDLQGNIIEAFQPVNENGNTVIGWGNYNKSAGNTNVYGHDVIIGLSNLGNKKDNFRPYRRQGDSIDITLCTAGYVTNAGKDVNFWIPMSVPIIGSPTVTVSSGNGFVLRQGDKYTHGSGASNMYAVPSSYAVTRTTYNGIHVKATFTNTDNVTNNDAIGIWWNGTITFS